MSIVFQVTRVLKMSTSHFIVCYMNFNHNNTQVKIFVPHLLHAFGDIIIHIFFLYVNFGKILRAQ